MKSSKQRNVARNGRVIAKIPRNMGITPEVSVFDVNTNFATTLAYQVLPLSNLLQGDAFNNRDGSVVQAKHIRVRITCQAPATSVIWSYARFILALSRYDQQALAITDAVNPGGSTAWNVTGAYNQDFVGQSNSDRRLIILQDKTLAFNTGGVNSAVIEWDMPLNHLIRWLASNSSNYPVDGGLVLFFCGQASSLDAGSYPTAYVYSRLEFLDS